MAKAEGLKFTVFGDPVGKERPRRGKYGNFYTPAKTKLYQNSVALAFVKAKEDRPSKTYKRVNITCYFRIKRHPDPDNVLKSVLDALNGLAYFDDKEIDSSVRIGGFDKAKPRIEVVLR